MSVFYHVEVLEPDYPHGTDEHGALNFEEHGTGRCVCGETWPCTSEATEARDDR